MTTDKPQLSVTLPEEDYQWLQEEASVASISKGAVLRQALSLYRSTGGLIGSRRIEIIQNIHIYKDGETAETANSVVATRQESK